MEIETLSKLYLELANILPETVLSSREIKLKRKADEFGLALLMISNGCEDPQEFAARTLIRVG